MNKLSKNKGFLMIELLVGIAVGAIILSGLVSLVVKSQQISQDNLIRLRANMYLREGVEAVKDLERSGWIEFGDVCTTVSPCHPDDNGGTVWTIEPNPDSALDGGLFERSLVIEPGAEAGIKKVTVTVEEKKGLLIKNSFSLETYVYEIFQ